jgi:hypothetical protein
MKKVLGVILLVLVIVLLLLLYKCNKKASSGAPKLGLSQVGYSVWSDGSLAVAIPIVNSGNRAAAGVTVSSVTLGSGTLIAPVSLPATLGEIVSGRRAVLQTRFASLAVPGVYTLAVSGDYTDGGSTHPFTASASLTVNGPPKFPISPTTTVSPKHQTSGIPTKPSPINRQDQENNPIGPPVPQGQVLSPFTINPTHTAPAHAPSPGPGGGMSVTFVRDTATGQSAGVPPDPSTAVATGAGVALTTANTYLLFSQNDGQQFPTVLDPTTIFPQSDGGVCCDGVVIYDQSVDLFFWMLQYSGSPNRLRVAYAHPADLKTNINAWSWFDLTQGQLNSGTPLDYPDIAVTGTYLYASVDGTDSKGNNGGLIVARMPLSDITGSGTSVNVTEFSPNESTEQDKAWASRLTQGSADAMYWAGHVDTSHLEVFQWADNSNNLDIHVTQENTYCNTDFTTLAPDGQQWLDNTRPAGTGGIIAATRQSALGKAAHGKVWFGWDAARDDASCTQGRPQPYVKIVQVDDSTLDSVGEYDIWNTPYAFGYPSLGTAPNGDVGVAVSFGGPSDYSSTTVGYLGDYVVYYVQTSDITLTFQLTNKDGTPKVDSQGNPVLGTRYGDMFAVRDSGPRNTYFSSLGYAYKFVDATKSTNCSVTPGCAYSLHYEQWGRGNQ